MSSSTPCKALLGAGSEGVLIFFALSEAFPSNTVLVSERDADFLGNRSYFFPILEQDVLFVDSPLLVMILFLKERTNSSILYMHTCNTCFISKDEVELQQDEENLPYEEEIYKDSSTFLKVSCFCNWKCSQSWPSCVKLFLQLMGSEIHL